MNEVGYEQNFKAGLYVRLSREDEDKNANDFSESIKNQKEFLSEYAIKHGYNIIDIYADDGISGTTFDRQDFNRMISDIEKGRINMVITKDLSRLGRDYIKTGEYLEKYFPEKNVRYIAVNDGYDSFKDENSNNEMAPFKAVFNDMYAKDISKKVRTALKTKQIKGEYLGTTPALGYKKDATTKGKLVIDETSSKYIKRIFSLYLSGKSILEISNILTKEGVPTPSQYAGVSNTQKYLTGVWNDKSVRFILKNEVYIGNTIQNKKRKVNYKINKQVELPKSQWIRVENTHEPIIEKKDFEMAQELLKSHSYNRKSIDTNRVNIHLLSGLLFCGNCGAPMTFIPTYNKREYYICCSTVKRYRKELNLCKRKLIKEKQVNNKIVEELKCLAKTYIKKQNIINKTGIENDEVYTQYLRAIKNIQGKIEDLQKVNINMYKDKVKEIITEKQFLQLLEESNREKEEHITKLQEMKKKYNELRTQEKNTNFLNEIIERTLNFEDIDRSTIGALIEKIIINNDESLEIEFKFKNPNY